VHGHLPVGSVGIRLFLARRIPIRGGFISTYYGICSSLLEGAPGRARTCDPPLRSWKYRIVPAAAPNTSARPTGYISLSASITDRNASPARGRPVRCSCPASPSLRASDHRTSSRSAEHPTLKRTAEYCCVQRELAVSHYQSRRIKAVPTAAVTGAPARDRRGAAGAAPPPARRATRGRGRRPRPGSRAHPSGGGTWPCAAIAPRAR
jgi:hypothetical protein